jgi:hypothetical protein
MSGISNTAVRVCSRLLLTEAGENQKVGFQDSAETGQTNRNSEGPKDTSAIYHVFYHVQWQSVECISALRKKVVGPEEFQECNVLRLGDLSVKVDIGKDKRIKTGQASRLIETPCRCVWSPFQQSPVKVGRSQARGRHG